MKRKGRVVKHRRSYRLLARTSLAAPKEEKEKKKKKKGRKAGFFKGVIPSKFSTLPKEKKEENKGGRKEET